MHKPFLYYFEIKEFTFFLVIVIIIIIIIIIIIMKSSVVRDNNYFHHVILRIRRLRNYVTLSFIRQNRWLSMVLLGHFLGACVHSEVSSANNTSARRAFYRN
jgi:hypothetical protein